MATRPTKKPAKKKPVKARLSRLATKEDKELGKTVGNCGFIIGRPRIFETPEDMRIAIQEYFDKTPPEEWMVTGLALVIGTSKDVFADYAKREGYAEIVRQARSIVEHAYEKRLIKHGRSGDIFALKNFDWKDKTEVHQSHTYTQMGRVKMTDKAGQVKELTFNVGEKRKR